MINSQYFIILVSTLIIFSYLFDLFARKTKFPSVILLMLTGLVGRLIADSLGYEIPYLNQLIPIMGSIGLVLIVLEGALELTVNRNKTKLIIRSLLSAFLLIVCTASLLTFLFVYRMSMTYEVALLNAISFSVISSAVAIPSSASLPSADREFVVYESTFSDIIGIMIFNYALNQFSEGKPLLGVIPIGLMILQIFAIIIFSAVLVWALFQLMGRLNHKVKFFLIFALLMIVYAIGKYYHLPLLVTIFIFGIFLANAGNFFPRFIRQNLPLKKATEGLHEFHLLTAESTFLVKTFFFLLFGYIIILADFDKIDYFVNGGIIVACIYLVRTLYLMLMERKRSKSLIYFAPRGLISILLFWQLQTGEFSRFKSEIIDEKVLLIVILLSMLVMMIGSIGYSKNEKEIKSEEEKID